MPTDPRPVTMENLAETLVRELPKPEVVVTIDTEAATPAPGSVLHVGVPTGFRLETIDTEPLLDHPRRTHASVRLHTPESFLDYVRRNADESTLVWCLFDPGNSTLVFRAIIDDHAKELPGWRDHQATFAPALSVQWQTWLGFNKKEMSQLDFGEFLERNEPDIFHAEGMPTSLQMLQLAQHFEATSERAIRSHIRLQTGGVRLEYVADDDDKTVQALEPFKQFAVGIPVFFAGPGYRVNARLKTRYNASKVAFRYELIQPEKMHEEAARELIALVEAGLGDVPLLMGQP